MFLNGKFDLNKNNDMPSVQTIGPIINIIIVSFFFFFCSDFTIKIIVVETSSHKVCHGHEAPILSVAIDPKDKYVVSNYLLC